MYVTLDVHVFLFVMRSGSIGTVTIYVQCSYIQFQRNKTENYEIIVAVDESGNANKFILPLIAINTTGHGMERTRFAKSVNQVSGHVLFCD